MSPYNAYSSSLSSSRLSSYTPSTKYSGSTGYSTLSSYRYKPPAYSSTLSSKYRSPSTYTSYSTPRTYTSPTLTRNFSSSYLSTRAPKFNSISSYESAITSSNDWKSSSDTTTERLWRSPSLSLSRRNSSSSLATLPRTPDRSPRPSLPAYTTLANSSFTPRSTRSPPPGPSFGNDASSDQAGRIGLVNLGNTCFMNAILQILLRIKSLMDYFLSNQCIIDINLASPSRGEMVKGFQEFVKQMLKLIKSGSYTPYELRKLVQRHAPRFLGDNQQDAQEFLRYFLQCLHEDTNRARQKVASRSSEPARDAVSAWRKYKETDDSVVMDIFAGLLKSTLRCNVCNNESVTYDPFWDLSLPLPEHSVSTSLRECINLFTSPEILDGMNKPVCSICKKKNLAQKRIEIARFPKVLVIHFKRFSSSPHVGQKINAMVEFPMALGSTSDFGATNNIGGSTNYSLCGIVDHDGSFSSGHYTSKCCDPDTNEWLEFNDTRVSTPAAKLASHKAYILFYAKKN